MSKITEQMKNKIIEDFEKGMSQRALAIKNSISLGSINKIVSGNHKTAINRKGTRPDGSVYLVYFKNNDDIYLKIGVATDIGLRINNLQTGNPFDLVLLYSRYFKNAYTVEREMHSLFSEYNFKSEWFFVTESIMQEIKTKIESF